MVFNSASKPFARTGTTSPIFISRAGSQSVRPGEYFLMKVHNSQAVFRGNLFESARQVVVTSKVNLNHALLGNQDIFAIQRTREIRNNTAQQLGLSPNLISLVPATMSNVFVTIDFLLDKENNLGKLSSLINSDGFLAVVSLAPGAAAVAKTVGSLAQQVLQTFIPDQQNLPILQFTGNFNIGSGNNELCDGYYAILGTMNQNDPLPTILPELTVRDEALLADGQPITQLSYVTLEVTRVPARTRELNEGAAWDTKLRNAEGLAQETVDDPFADDSAKRDTWGKCKATLQDARALLLADPRYAPGEVDQIYKAVYKKVADLLSRKADGEAKPFGVDIDTKTDRAEANIPLDEDLASTSAQYEKTSQEAQRILKANNLL